MPPIKPKKNKKPEQLPAPEDIDTSVLNLKQLQEFCVRVYREVEKVGWESRTLELERNKIKLYADVANSQLNEEKSRLRWTENELERDKEQFVLKLLDVTNKLRNVRVESAQNCNNKMEETFAGLQLITQSSFESCNEIVQDINVLLTSLRNIEVEHLNTTTRLNIEHDRNKSELLQHDADSRKVTLVHQKIRKREAIKNVAEKCSKELGKFTQYKDKIVKQMVAKNDKDTLHTRHYYEKTLDTNRTVLENLHGKCKTAKGNLTSYKQQVTTLRQEVDRAEKEIDANRNVTKATSVHMVDSAHDKGMLQTVQSDYMRKKESVMERKAENMVLEEILAISEKEIERKIKPGEEELLSLQLRAIKQITCLEQLVDRLRGQLTKLDQLIEFAVAKRKYAGRRMSCRQSTRLALQSLSDDAARELSELRRISMLNHLNSQ